MISPALTLTVDKTVASPGENVVLSGSLDIPREQGDIVKDNVINVKDAVILGMAFGSKKGDPNYNPDADLNGDGFINIKDAVILAQHFLQKSGDKPIILYVSSDGVTWTELARVTTSSTLPMGVFTYTDTIPTNTPTPSVRYYMAYFPGGVY
jgi:hypothetical protein